jgi:Uma2 family endonuclease
MAVGQRVGPKRRRWTRKEFYRLLDLGFFRRQRVELIEGEILVMPPQKNFHAIAIALTDNSLRGTFGPGYWVRVQASLDLSPYSVPDPNLAVVTGSPRDNLSEDNPTTALLLVEVSDTTLSYDRHRKASVYARKGIEDYWIVNLVHRQLEVYRDPIADSTYRYGYRYSSRTDLAPADYVSPLVLPQAKISVADLLP